MTQPLRIDVYLDLICPWCWIGKRHLGVARTRLAELRPDVRIEVGWHSVQLIPDVPPQGWPYQAFYERRLGGPEAVRARQAQVQAAASQAGLSIRFERMETFPNTWQAHRLLAQAGPQLEPPAQEALLEALFEAYFVHGSNLSDPDTLEAMALAHGVNTSNSTGVDAPDVWGSTSGVSGVPLFVFNQRWALSGAQSPEALVSAMLQSLPQTATSVA